MFKTIDIHALNHVTGGAGAGYNTGITGGIKGINNKVPRPHSGGHNTGITGGIPGINNKVPWFDF
jgi:bacteriocin-like protein